MTTFDTVFQRTSQAKRDFQLDQAMNCGAEAQGNIRAEVPPTATLGIAHQRHCAQHHRHHSPLCRRGGEGEGALWFPVLWVILPHSAPVVP